MTINVLNSEGVTIDNYRVCNSNNSRSSVEEYLDNYRDLLLYSQVRYEYPYQVLVTESSATYLILIEYTIFVDNYRVSPKLEHKDIVELP